MTWTISDEELEKQITNATKKTNKEPRVFSLVRFADDSMFRKTYLINPDGTPNTELEKSRYSRMLYLGPISNQLGHGAYINLISFNTIHVIDIDELVELTQDEVL